MITHIGWGDALCGEFEPYDSSTLFASEATCVECIKIQNKKDYEKELKRLEKSNELTRLRDKLSLVNMKYRDLYTAVVDDLEHEEECECDICCQIATFQPEELTEEE